MISLQFRDETDVQSIFNQEKVQQLTYEPVGLSRLQQAPSGFHPNSYTDVIGQGKDQFDKAIDIMTSLNHLNIGWVTTSFSRNNLTEDLLICIQTRSMGLCAFTVSKVITLIDEEDEQYINYGYIMGTTPFHVVKGEECFLLQYDKVTQDVRFTIFSYSTPSLLLVKLGGIILRRGQRRFVRAVIEHMKLSI